MSKRRRASSGASRGADGDDSDDGVDHTPGPPPSARKTKKLDPSEMCQQLYETIRSFKKDDGTLLCDAFIRAPKRRQEPQYYEVVTQPIDLLRVQQKLKMDIYEDLDELSADFELLVNNTKAFYKPDTVEYKDATELWKLYTQTKHALENGEDVKPPRVSRTGSLSRRSDVAEDLSETSTNNEEDNIFEELFIADSKPQFTNLINTTIGQDVEIKLENSLDDSSLASPATPLSEGDNSNPYNPYHPYNPSIASNQEWTPGKTATPATGKKKKEQKQKIVTGYILYSKEIRKAIIANNPESNFRMITRLVGNEWRSLPPATKQSWKERAARCNEEISPRLAEEIREPTQHSEMCQQLYESIRSFKKDDGTLLCDAFIRAPKRRQEPQYYEVVTQPIDLLRVQQKLNMDIYEDLDELSADIELLVNNAKAFYKPDTVEYKDATELWKLYTQTKHALENGGDVKPPRVSRTGFLSQRSDVAEDLSETSTNIFDELFSADSKPQFTNLINTTIGQDVEIKVENSLDDSSLASPATPLSEGDNSNPYNPYHPYNPSIAATPATDKKKKEQKQKFVTGYILYSSEIRKAISANNPESTFGMISQIVGNEWSSLPPATKQSWQERAARCNEETSARLAEEMRELTQHSTMEMTYECAWDTCDHQFEALADCMEHCIGDGGKGTGHVQEHFRGHAGGFPCVWRNCGRVLKGQAPFPNLSRVLRHVRDLHLYKGNGRPIPAHERSRNFIPSSRKPQPPKTYTNSFRGGVMSPVGNYEGRSIKKETPAVESIMEDGDWTSEEYGFCAEVPIKVELKSENEISDGERQELLVPR